MIGLETFDDAVGGIFAGELVVLAARPSIGKTALAIQVSRHVASKGRLVYFASLEMDSTQFALRLVCASAGVPMASVRAGELGDGDVRAVGEAARSFGDVRIVIHDQPGLCVHEIRRACRRLAPKGLGLIVVDYLQRVTPEDRRADRHLQIGQITWALKALALELKVPVLVLSQLGRAAEERNRKTGMVIEPRLSHLKESGDIEQDADMVLLLHRQQRAKEAELILAKNRQGEQGKFHLTFDAARTLFKPRVDGYSEFDGFAGDGDL
jgi:replicative DNA helicase